MPSRKDCIDDIIGKAGGRLSRAEAERIFEEMDERARQRYSEGKASRSGFGRGAEEMIDEASRRAAIARRAVRLDGIKSRDINRFADAVLNTAGAGKHHGRFALEAPLVGVAEPLFDQKSLHGNRRSASALGTAQETAWIGGVERDLEALGKKDEGLRDLVSIFRSGQIERAVFIEKAELENQARGAAANPGRTNNPQALAIAKVLKDWDKVRITSLNGEGAWIEELSAWMFRSSHDPDRVRKASNPRVFRRGMTNDDAAAYVGDALRWFDTERMFPGMDQGDVEAALRRMWGGIVDGTHGQPAAPTADPIFPSVAAKVSQSRTAIYKTPEAALDYNAKYGRMSPTQTWYNSMREDAHRLALMKIFGSRPREGWANYQAYVMNSPKVTPEQRFEVQRWEKALENRFRVVSGEVNIPVASIWSGIVNANMAVQRMSKLVFTPFAMLQDNVSLSRELSRHGMGFGERNADLFAGYFKGFQGSERREFMELLHSGVVETYGDAGSRWDTADVRRGFLAKAQEQFFRWTGQTAMTANKRGSAMGMMARNLAMQSEKEFGVLDEGLQRLLHAYGIGEHEWNLIRKGDLNKLGEEGRTYLTPDVATRLTDAQVESYLKERDAARGGAPLTTAPLMARGAEGEIVVGTDLSRVERARQDLALNMWAFFSDRSRFAVIEATAKERAMLYRGTQTGTPENAALRLIMQFKQFTAAMITRSWMEEIYGGNKGMGRVAGLVELVIGSTLFGMAANYMTQMAKGQDPNSQIRNQPVQWLMAGFLRGGAGSIYGDFLLGEWSRHGRQLLDSLVGPTLGQTNTIAEMWTELTHATGSRGAWTKPGVIGSQALTLARSNFPFFINMIYTKTIFDYLVYYKLQEMLNPGYLDRMERTQKEKQGIEYWVRPSQIAK